MGNAVRMFAAVACGALTAGLLVGGSLAWRLSRGPIRLDLLTPRLEAALSAPDGSSRVDIASTSFEWDPQDRDLDFRLRDLRVLGPGGDPVAVIRALTFGIAPGPLLLGAVVPDKLEAIAPRIHVVRERDGRLEVGIGGEPATATTRLLLGALMRGAPRGGLAGLRSIGVRDGEVVLDDRASGITWHATGVAAAVRRETGGLTIEHLAFDLEPASVEATGRIRAGAADLDVAVERLPTRVLERWWPDSVAPAVRRWVLANVSGGRVTAARGRVTGVFTDQGEPRLTLGGVRGDVAFAGLAVRWRDGMPPLAGVGGTGTFSAGGWQLRLARGELEGLEVVRALVAAAPGAAPGIRVDAVVRSPLSKALALLDRPGIRAVANFPFRPGEISGGVTARVVAQVPPDGGGVEVQAHGDLRSVSLRRAFRGRNVNARRLRFELDGREFEMRGPITIGHAPLELRWREALAGGARGERVITIKGRLDAEGRDAFGADLHSWLTGPVDVEARLSANASGTTGMDLGVDLTRASIDLPLINIVKDPGAPGSAQARLAVARGRVAAIDELRLQAAGSSLTGRALLDPNERLRSAQGMLDVAPRSEGGPAAHVSFALEAAGTGTRLTVTSDDAGGVFRAIDSYADATAGRMTLDGIVRLNLPGMPLRGILSVDRFVLRRSPMIAKIAALGSIGGVIDLLASDGLPVSRLAVSFTQRGGVINITEAVAASPGMALTARGTVDRVRDELSLDGTLVPNYDGLDRLLQSARLATTELTVFAGERTKAVEFSASGSLADPYVTAKPADLAPGTLRDLMRLTTRVEPSRTSKRRGAGEGDETAPEAEIGRTRKKKRVASGSSSKSAATSKTRARSETGEPAKPRVRRRAPAAPSAPDTGTE